MKRKMLTWFPKSSAAPAGLVIRTKRTMTEINLGHRTWIPRGLRITRVGPIEVGRWSV